jgi:hypothetical protein
MEEGMSGTMWTVDYDTNEADPGDGGPPLCFWWDDMRMREVVALVQEAYSRGLARGCREVAERVADVLRNPLKGMLP